MAEVGTKHVPSLGLGILEGTHTRFLGFPGKSVYKSVVLLMALVSSSVYCSYFR